MAVCWRCPVCLEVSCETDAGADGMPLACDHCERAVLPIEALCAICDAPNPWSRRDSIHFICRECGEQQTFYGRSSVAVTSLH
jgi:predicted amidophosphoribosyltransferase